MNKQNRIKQIAAASGWAAEKVETELARVKEMGILPRDYFSNKAWTMNEEELNALGDKLRRQNALWKENLKIVQEATGWSEAEAKKQVSETRAVLNTLIATYVKNELWYLDSAEMPSTLKEAKKAVAKRKKYIETVCMATGWDRMKARDELIRAAGLGMSNYYYCRYQAWNLNDDEIAEQARVVTAAKAKREHPKKGYLNIKKIAAASGWTTEKVETELARVKEMGILPRDYFNNKAWTMNEEELNALGDKLRRQNALWKENLKIVQEATGWSEAEAKKQVSGTRAVLNTPIATYVKNELWYLDSAEMPSTLSEAQKAVAKRKKYIETVCAATGWDRMKARDELIRAAGLGMSNYFYCRYQAWNLNDDEIAEQARVVATTKAKREHPDEWYLNICVEKSGKPREEIEAQMRELREAGITYQKYAERECYNMLPEELDSMIRLAQKDKVRIASNKEKYIEKVCQETGWSRAKADMEMAKAKVNCGATHEDYCVFKLYELSPEEQKKYVTFDLFSKMKAKYNNAEPAWKYFNDKAEFNRTFSDLINRRWFVNRNLSYEDFLKQIDGLSAVLVKPLKATKGAGIGKFRCNVWNKKALYKKIMERPVSIVEQYIVQHPDVMAFCKTSVNTVRITTLNANGKCNYIYAVFRMGRGKVVDNFHAGGIAAAVDMRTGVVITHAADVDGNVYPVNPYSGLAMRGFQIPHWDKILETCEKAYNRVPGMNLIGWDFAITPDGVDLIEGNPGASYVMAQIPFVQHRVGLRDVMVDPYL